MRDALACYSVIVSLVILAVFVVWKVMILARYVSLPKAVAAAIKSRLPDCRMLSIEWNDLSHTYEIEASDRSTIHTLEVASDGEIVHDDSDADVGLRTFAASPAHASL